ncbi:hypothetical protein [Streptomyces rubellomurinus]|uniref:Uncharacterized protein n=1 Tax=Streptomyces sp. Y1 TaxID=3238634 RepID=A0AB39TN48_9ACTN|nr:hypothetical protein [Streptomyces rubellomurinus]
MPESGAWHEQDVDEAIAAGERGKVLQDGEAFLRSLADEAGLDLWEIKRRAGV